MKIPRRKLWRLAAEAAVLPAMSRALMAQDYPTRPIHLIVGFPPGKAPDVIARLIGQRLADQFGKSVVIQGVGQNGWLQGARP
jgi:tripartite-type tricarboxylate transporter receptor subunit TctC